MLRSCWLAFLIMVPLASASAEDAVRWRLPSSYVAEPDSCVGWAHYEIEKCPDPLGSTFVEDSVPFPTLLTQLGAHGGLARVRAGNITDPSLSARHYMSQAVAARQLADGSTALLTAEFLPVSGDFKFRAHLSLLGVDGQLRWSVPMGGIQTMEHRDNIAATVLESVAGGDLIAVVHTGQLRVIRVRRSDGRVEARTDRTRLSAGSAYALATAADKANASWADHPFRAWVGPAGLHVMNDYGWLQLDPDDFHTRQYRPWTEAFGANAVIRALQPIPGTDQAVVLARIPGTEEPGFKACAIRRVHADGSTSWATEVQSCDPAMLLELAGTERLVFSGARFNVGYLLVIADSVSGAVEHSIVMQKRPLRLAATASHAAFVGLDASPMSITGIELASGNVAYDREFPYYASGVFLDSIAPNIATNGTDAFALHYGSSLEFDSHGFQALVLDAASGVAREALAPAPVAAPLDVKVLGHVAAGVIRAIPEPMPEGWRWRVSLVDTASGQVRWERQISSALPLNSPRSFINEHHLLLMESMATGATTRRYRTQMLSLADGTDVYIDDRVIPTLPAAGSITSYNFESLSPESRLVYVVLNGNTTVIRVLGPDGQLLWERDLQAAPGVSFSEDGRVLLSYPSEYFVLDDRTGDQRTLGAPPALATAVTHGAVFGAAHGTDDLIFARSIRTGSQRSISVERRRPDTGIVWSRSVPIAGTNNVFIYAHRILANGDPIFDLRTSTNALVDHHRLTLRFAAATGELVWQRTGALPNGVVTACRAFGELPNGDITCPDTWSEPASALAGYDPLQTFIQRLDGATGETRGVHWLSIETEAQRGVFHGAGISTRLFTAADSTGFAYLGPAQGTRAFSTNEIGWIRAPIGNITGDLSVSTSGLSDGFVFEVLNQSNAPAAAVEWAIDASDGGAIGSLECTGSALQTADARTHGARGRVDLAAGGSLRCELRWLASTPGALRSVVGLAWPAYDYLDTDAHNNVVRYEDALLKSGFE